MHVTDPVFKTTAESPTSMKTKRDSYASRKPRKVSLRTNFAYFRRARITNDTKKSWASDLYFRYECKNLTPSTFSHVVCEARCHDAATGKPLSKKCYKPSPITLQQNFTTRSGATFTEKIAVSCRCVKCSIRVLIVSIRVRAVSVSVFSSNGIICVEIASGYKSHFI